jgi:hypothetical protein
VKFTRLPAGHRRDCFDLLTDLLAGAPNVGGLLHIEPEVWAVAAELAEPQRHFRRHSGLLGQQPMKLLPCHAQVFRRLRHADVLMAPTSMALVWIIASFAT